MIGRYLGILVFSHSTKMNKNKIKSSGHEITRTTEVKFTINSREDLEVAIKLSCDKNNIKGQK